MNSAIEHNNNAITLLQKGLYEQSLSEFKKAAQMMYSLTQKLKHTAIDGLANNSEQHGATTTQCATTQLDIVSDCMFIRTRPIAMTYTDEPKSSCTVESATILMNMALCYHLDSMRPNCMPDAQQNAITLYEMAYSLGLQINEDRRSHDLILTSLNNLGQIYNELGDYSRSRNYFEDLTTYVLFLGPANQGESATNDRHEFMLNAMVLRNPNTSAAAA